MVPEWLLDSGVSGQAIKLYAILGAKFASRDDNSCYPTRDKLAEAMGCSLDSIDRFTAELEQAGALVVVTKGIAGGNGRWAKNVYHIQIADPGRKSAAIVPENGRKSAAENGRKSAAVTRINDPESLSLAAMPQPEPKETPVKAPPATKVTEEWLAEQRGKYAPLIGVGRFRETIDYWLGNQGFNMQRDKRGFLIKKLDALVAGAAPMARTFSMDDDPGYVGNRYRNLRAAR